MNHLSKDQFDVYLDMRDSCRFQTQIDGTLCVDDAGIKIPRLLRGCSNNENKHGGADNCQGYNCPLITIRQKA